MNYHSVSVKNRDKTSLPISKLQKRKRPLKQSDWLERPRDLLWTDDSYCGNI